MQRMPTLSETDLSLFELKTRYVRNYLTFAGKNSKDFLLYISCSISPAQLCMTVPLWMWNSRPSPARTVI